MLLGDNTLENALVDKVKPFLPPTKFSLENEPTTLKKECLRVIRSDLQHFQPKITNPELLQEIISSEDPSDLPCHGASFIDHEGFYKKASIDKFGNEVNCLNGLECHGLSYKRLYLERHFAGIMASPKSDIYEMVWLMNARILLLFDCSSIHANCHYFFPNTSLRLKQHRIIFSHSSYGIFPIANCWNLCRNFLISWLSNYNLEIKTASMHLLKCKFLARRKPPMLYLLLVRFRVCLTCAASP